jgi:hypothetical protein
MHRFREVEVDEFAHAGGEVPRDTAIGDLDLAPGSMRTGYRLETMFFQNPDLLYRLRQGDRA